MSEYWSRTQELYSPFISYPKMTDKLLKRPPFKYILQIFISTNKKTNFAVSLFDPKQLDKSYYDSPEKKLRFIKKLFAFLYKVLDKDAPVKPKNIIKGAESDKVNEFLCDMYEVAISGRNYQRM